MPKVVIHTDDLPQWVLKKSKLPKSLLGHLREAIYPSPDGKRMLSAEDVMLRQHFEAMLTGSVKARDWLLRRIIKDNTAVLEASAKRPTVTINAIEHFRPLAPVLEVLGHITVSEAEEGSNEPSTIEFSPRFLEGLAKHCSEKKLAPVKRWLDAGGKQQPRINRDLL